MATKYTNLDELRSEKRLLKQEIGELEDILTFKSKKESLGILTHGFTDKFLKETQNVEGKNELSLNTQNIMREISSSLKESASKKNVMSLANDTLSSGLLETTIKMGVVSLVGNFAKKSVMNKNWKRKVLGLALIYVAPYALRFVRKKLDEYQRNKTASSLEKLI
ncbi:phosphoribosyl-ATP pyrophosphatase [Epilithonimonas sp.]|uniref:phosphoribosyl-ATP pyrophosphatase n=1 Tax=Epilithonimonas sp. TaxID=2894511 RepID=UPI002FDD392B